MLAIIYGKRTLSVEWMAKNSKVGIILLGKLSHEGGGLVSSWTLTSEKEVVLWGACVGPFMVGALVGSKVGNLDGLEFGNSLFLGATSGSLAMGLGLRYLVMVAGVTGNMI